MPLNMHQETAFVTLSAADIPEMVPLVQQLNPGLSPLEIQTLHESMFTYPGYYCFGYLLDGQLVGVAGGWMTVRFYSGKQLEADHVIIDATLQGSGLGARFLHEIEQWAYREGCKTVELNTYVQNVRSHRFYYREGYHILGFHFQKKLKAGPLS